MTRGEGECGETKRYKLEVAKLRMTRGRGCFYQNALSAARPLSSYRRREGEGRTEEIEGDPLRVVWLRDHCARVSRARLC